MSKEYSILDRLVAKGIINESDGEQALELLKDFEHLEAVKELKKASPPNQVKKDLNTMFMSYLQSDLADDKQSRLRITAAYQYLEDFLTIISPTATN